MSVHVVKFWVEKYDMNDHAPQEDQDRGPQEVHIRLRSLGLPRREPGRLRPHEDRLPQRRIPEAHLDLG